MINNITKNCMGTLSFDGKFNGMRKAQDFIVYPLSKDDNAEKIKIQSDKRIGWIDLITGDVILTKSFPNGAYNPHLIFAQKIDCLTNEELAGLKYRLIQTASDKTGNNALHVITDNSNANKVSIF